MRTRIATPKNAVPGSQAHSFQYLTGSGWAYPVHADRTVMVWSTEAARDNARCCFTHRKTAERAQADLLTLNLVPATT